MTTSQILIVAGVLIGTLAVLLIIAACMFPAFRRELLVALANILQDDERSRGGKGRGRDSEPRYRAVAGVLTPGERAFLPHIEAVLPSVANHMGVPPLRALLKVRLADLVEPDCSRDKGSPYMSWFGRISQKHVDVVLVDAADFRPVCVVELDDRSHRSARARERDAVKDEVLASAAIPLVRIPAASGYDARDIARRLVEAMGSGGSAVG